MFGRAKSHASIGCLADICSLTGHAEVCACTGLAVVCYASAFCKCGSKTPLQFSMQTCTPCAGRNRVLYTSCTQRTPRRRLGTRVDWAVALHAYGNPLASDWGARAPFQGITLADVPRVVAYQAAKLAEARTAGGGGNATDGAGLAPQELLVASEQGWANPPNTARAPLAGAAHRVALSFLSLLGVRHANLHTCGCFGAHAGSQRIVRLKLVVATAWAPCLA